MFLAYIWLAWYGAALGRLVGPKTLTLSTSTTSSALVTSQLPPVAAARSMITEPGSMPLSMSAVTSTGALRPGMAAVEMTTSLPATTLPISSR